MRTLTTPTEEYRCRVDDTILLRPSGPMAGHRHTHQFGDTCRWLDGDPETLGLPQEREGHEHPDNREWSEQ